MKGLKSGSQCKYDVRYHFVWIPRYRKRVLNGRLKDRLEGMIRYACQVNNWEVYELSIQKDHVHLYMGSDPKSSPSEIMMLIKGGTSKKIKKMFGEELRDIYWASTFWADGYMVKSVGEMTDKVISQYIKRQKVVEA